MHVEFETSFSIDTTVDVLSGGFPCQPFSVAGKRRGTEDDRMGWNANGEHIREKPRVFEGENPNTSGVGENLAHTPRGGWVHGKHEIDTAERDKAQA